MEQITAFSFDEAPLFEGAIQAFRFVRSDFPVDAVNRQIDRLVKSVTKETEYIPHKDLQVGKLLELFYGKWGFHMLDDPSCMYDALQPDWVLEHRQGHPIIFGLLLLEICRQLELPIEPVLVVRYLFMRGAWSDEDVWLIDCKDGSTVDMDNLNYVLGAFSDSEMDLEASMLKEARYDDVITLYLRLVKNALTVNNKLEDALRVADMVVRLNPYHAHYYYERGVLRARLGGIDGAIKDLKYFLKRRPPDVDMDVSYVIAQIEQLERQKTEW